MDYFGCLFSMKIVWLGSLMREGLVTSTFLQSEEIDWLRTFWWRIRTTLRAIECWAAELGESGARGLPLKLFEYSGRAGSRSSNAIFSRGSKFLQIVGKVRETTTFGA